MPRRSRWTGALAAIATGRDFVGIENDPQYFRIAVRRIEKVLEQKRLPGM